MSVRHLRSIDNEIPTSSTFASVGRAPFIRMVKVAIRERTVLLKWFTLQLVEKRSLAPLKSIWDHSLAMEKCTKPSSSRASLSPGMHKSMLFSRSMRTCRVGTSFKAHATPFKCTRHPLANQLPRAPSRAPIRMFKRSMLPSPGTSPWWFHRARWTHLDSSLRKTRRKDKIKEVALSSKSRNRVVRAARRQKENSIRTMVISGSQKRKWRHPKIRVSNKLLISSKWWSTSSCWRKETKKYKTLESKRSSRPMCRLNLLSSESLLNSFNLIKRRGCLRTRRLYRLRLRLRSFTN